MTSVIVDVPTPGALAEDVVRAVLDHGGRASRFGNASMLVVLQAGEAAWRPDGGEFTGPGVVHYWRYRDNGDVGAGAINAYSVADIVRAATAVQT